MNKKLFLIILLLVSLACALPSVPTPVVNNPPADIGALETIIVQTAGAAQTRTALAIPTSTSTSTPTRIPSITPTPTVTFIYLLPTLTPIPTITPIGFVPSGGGSVGTQDASKFKTPQPWSCRVTSTQPPKGTVIEKKLVFTTFWRILNTGTKTWTRTTIDLIYTGGYRHENTRIQDTTETVPPGGTLTVSAKFTAPKTAGDYNSYFTLMVGKQKFCGMVVSFTVAD